MDVEYELDGWGQGYSTECKGFFALISYLMYRPASKCISSSEITQKNRAFLPIILMGIFLSASEIRCCELAVQF